MSPAGRPRASAKDPAYSSNKVLVMDALGVRFQIAKLHEGIDLLVELEDRPEVEDRQAFVLEGLRVQAKNAEQAIHKLIDALNTSAPVAAGDPR